MNHKCVYVSQRLLYDLCGIITPIIPEHEQHYLLLVRWMQVFTNRFAHRIPLPRRRDNHAAVRRDLAELYSGILSHFENSNSPQVLNCLFTITYYLMAKYQNNPVTCSYIGCGFVAISRNLQSWNSFPESYDRNL